MSSNISPALSLLIVPMRGLREDARNTRHHADRSIDAIAASLEKFSQRKPIVVQRDGMIVRAGNGTLRAARKLGWTEIAAVVVDESDVQATAYAIADNRTAELSDWDIPQLLQIIEEAKIDLAQFPLGFSDEEFAALRGPTAWDQLGAESPAEPGEANVPVQIPVYLSDFTHREEVTAALEAFLPITLLGKASLKPFPRGKTKS